MDMREKIYTFVWAVTRNKKKKHPDQRQKYNHTQKMSTQEEQKTKYIIKKNNEKTQNTTKQQ